MGSQPFPQSSVPESDHGFFEQNHVVISGTLFILSPIWQRSEKKVHGSWVLGSKFLI